MTFEKKVLFLGMQEMKFNDGNSMFSVEVFSQEDAGSVKVFVMGTRKDIIDSLQGLSFGTVVNASFRLQEDNKRYKLQLIKVVRDGKAA